MEIAIAVLTVLAALIPVLVKNWSAKQETKHDLTDRSLDELHAGTDRVRGQKPPV